MLAKIVIAITVVTVLFSFSHTSECLAEGFDPTAPACASWLPHGYGGDMWVVNTTTHDWKGLHGFRVTPDYIGCVGTPSWGCDVNTFWGGPNVSKADPGAFQLPIGLIYPGNGPSTPPPGAPMAGVPGPPMGGQMGPMPMGPMAGMGGPMPGPVAPLVKVRR